MDVAWACDLSSRTSYGWKPVRSCLGAAKGSTLSDPEDPALKPRLRADQELFAEAVEASEHRLCPGPGRWHC